MNKIVLKKKFGGEYQFADKNEAVEFARAITKMITMGKSKEDTLNLVNNKLVGIKLTMDDLK
jgi:H2-forming N5,N10-methylenetetrahydromethanopterin dehydrogenase-like enzyme